MYNVNECYATNKFRVLKRKKKKQQKLYTLKIKIFG